MHDPGQPSGNGPQGQSMAGGPDVPQYELLATLGRGGMGVVYAARDLRLNREVAVKLLREEYAADSRMAARFSAEAQITVQLQHPGIPAVHELGALPDGRPFLVMKLVKGQTLAALLQEGADPGAQRGRLLAIFEQVCQAVGYAHARRVIHRDLKPANVMVGKFGEVQVMDWGLAKLLPAEGAVPPPGPDGLPPDTGPPITAIDTPGEAGRGTRTGQVMGTPAYMAPEQAGGERDRVNVRSDVFGLGAILCEVLTGQPPYRGADANALRLQAVRGEVGDALARLDGCGADAELVALCRRCLAFRPEDRPADGGAVAAAVAGVRAAAEERARRAERERAEALVREAEQRKRRRVWLGLAASLLVGAIAAGGLALWADSSRRRAEQASAAEAEARRTAAAKEEETRAVLAFLVDRVFAAARPRGQDGGLGSNVSLREALENALAFIDKDLVDQPLIEARLRTTLGTSFQYLGDEERAREQYQRALDLRQAALGDDDPDTLRSMNNLANSYESAGEHPAALALREKALPAMEKRLGADDRDTLRCMNNLANSYAALNRQVEALKLRQQTLERRKAALGDDDPDTLVSMNNLAKSYESLRRYDEALRLYRLALEGRSATLPADHPDTLVSMHNLAQIYVHLRRSAEAGELFQKALEGWQRHAAQPGNVRAQLFVVYLQGRLGGVEELRQQFAAAAAAYSRALKGFDQLARAGKLEDAYFVHAQDFFRRRLAICNKAEQAVADLDWALRQPAAEVPDLLDARLRVLSAGKDRAGVAATAAAWQRLAERDTEQCYRAAAAWSLAGALAADERERAEDTARALTLLRHSVKGKTDSTAPLLLAWRLEQDPDFTPLRSRPDFVAFVGDLRPADGAMPPDAGPKKD